METQILQALDPVRDGENIMQAAEVLRGGGLVVFPTETVYGIGADALNPQAVTGIFAAKGRPADNPLIVHVTSPEHIGPLVRDFPPEAESLAKAFWPGPLTIILPKSPAIPDVTSGGLDTVAVRMPSHPVARALIGRSGVPVAAPSANLSGTPSPTSAQHCIFDLSGKVDVILDGGGCDVGMESTVVSLAGKKPSLLRPGAVTLSQLREVLGGVEVDPAVTRRPEEGRPALSPGMKYRHYAPRAKLTLLHGGADEMEKYLKGRRGNGTWLLVFDEDLERFGENAVSYGAEKSPASQARRLFSALRELDDAGAETVYARAPSTSGVGLAVYNRLLRAAGFNEIYL